MDALFNDPAQEKPQEYRVLARKYRPQNFDDLIGQDALVRTLKNAIESGRIAHAFMLTGIRGVGKTTTARIIAKALNYTGADGQSGPTTGATDDCTICQAIAEDRHPDIMEMDAASRTGIDDIREILDGVRYAPTSARYKIYIIDEVHMLSKSAFNALLKTLEEPPEHVKFIFATTEIRKVPITVLSRCQRFDLKRIDQETLHSFYTDIAAKENATAEPDAITMIARAADGSVRDGLSLLDQAIALGDGAVTVDQVKTMLGLADRSQILDLLDFALQGDTKSCLDLMQEQYKSGADPVVIMQDLLDITHHLTKLRALPADASTMTEGEQKRLHAMADTLSMPTLARTWQLLLKGLHEVRQAPNPQSAAEMVMIRLMYAADLPDPAQLLKKKLKNPDDSVASKPQSASPYAPTPSPQGQTIQQGQAQAPTALAPQPLQDTSDHHTTARLESLADIVQLLKDHQEVILASHIQLYAHLVSLKDGLLEFRPAQDAPPKLAQDLARSLKSITGARWVVTISNEKGQPTLDEQDKERYQALEQKALADPLAQTIQRLFPGATMNNVRYKN